MQGRSMCTWTHIESYRVTTSCLLVFITVSRRLEPKGGMELLYHTITNAVVNISPMSS